MTAYLCMACESQDAEFASFANDDDAGACILACEWCARCLSEESPRYHWRRIDERSGL